MIDLHSHILAFLDDGAEDIVTSIAMARIAVADGITHMACTPHIVPGKYENSTATILPAMHSLQVMLDAQSIPLRLTSGADVHIAPDLLDRLQAGDIPTLNHTRYFLLEPPHEILPPRLEEFAARLLEAGFVPIITHPERLSWAGRHFDVIQRLADLGCPLQLTADSLTGVFGPVARQLSERILREGRASFFASDAHGASWRKPVLSGAFALVAEQFGRQDAEQMFHHRPAAILSNAEPAEILPTLRTVSRGRARKSFAQRLVARVLGNE
ncbi:tyrosine-protein phosphatase [Aquamicrobium segne]|uniref:protein-tyrosine-phosphatase n=1 Tax=Aquamicrobium segne TaxID=469547 RepID=A0ABW0GUG7_9HYPH